MNDMSAQPGGGSGDGEDPPIVLLSIGRQSYYVVRGDEYLNQLLLVDGDFPKPILCLHCDSIIDVKRVMGAGFSLADCWAVHPEIIARLRKDECLIEADE